MFYQGQVREGTTQEMTREGRIWAFVQKLTLNTSVLDKHAVLGDFQEAFQQQARNLTHMTFVMSTGHEQQQSSYSEVTFTAMSGQAKALVKVYQCHWGHRRERVTLGHGEWGCGLQEKGAMFSTDVTGS